MSLPRKDRTVPLRMPVGRKSVFLLLCTGLAALPLLPAQPDTPPMRLTFGIDQRLSVARNEPLRVPAEGVRSLSNTALSFGFVSETPLDRLRIDGRTVFRLGRIDGSGTVSELQDPRLSFSYSREGADSGIDLSGSFRRSRVDFLRPLEDFINEEGDLELPEDDDEIRGSGRRTDYSARARLVLGREAAPLGVTLEASVNGVDYSEAAANRNDRERRTLGANFRLRFSPVLSGRVDLSHSRYREDRAVDPIRRRTDRAQVGLVYALSPRTRVDTGLGWTRIDSNRPDEDRRGLNARFDIGSDLPTGSIGLGVNLDQTIDGTRSSLVARRAMELPDGSLSARLGVTRLPRSGDVGLIGGLAWDRALPTGRIRVRLDRSVIGDEERRFRTNFSTSYAHEISEVSSLSLRLDHSHTTGSDTRNEVRLSNVRASYSHRLTPDWSLNSGVGYRMRREEGVGRASSPSVFVGIGRQFEFPL